MRVEVKVVVDVEAADGSGVIEGGPAYARKSAADVIRTVLEAADAHRLDDDDFEISLVDVKAIGQTDQRKRT